MTLQQISIIDYQKHVKINKCEKHEHGFAINRHA
jgi:hypothetical protein